VSDPNVKYSATMARLRWRNLYIKVEIASPGHKAAQRWLAAFAAEVFEVAEVEIKAGGDLRALAFEAKRGQEEITLELSRDAVLGMKYAIVAALDGRGGQNARPSPLLERRDLLASCDKVGPDGVFRRLVEKEAKLPEDTDLDEGSELADMAPKVPVA
jgi:hypothetical protein